MTTRGRNRIRARRTGSIGGTRPSSTSHIGASHIAEQRKLPLFSPWNESPPVEFRNGRLVARLGNTMKIAQISPLMESCPPQLYGGTERVVSYLTEELVRQGHDVTLFASGDSITSARLEACCERARRLDANVGDPVPDHLIMLDKVRRRRYARTCVSTLFKVSRTVGLLQPSPRLPCEHRDGKPRSRSEDEGPRGRPQNHQPDYEAESR
jgi:hypothetical protein